MSTHQNYGLTGGLLPANPPTGNVHSMQAAFAIKRYERMLTEAVRSGTDPIDHEGMSVSVDEVLDAIDLMRERAINRPFA